MMIEVNVTPPTPSFSTYLPTIQPTKVYSTCQFQTNECVRAAATAPRKRLELQKWKIQLREKFIFPISFSKTY